MSTITAKDGRQTTAGAFAAQLAKQAGLHVVATAGSTDLDYLTGKNSTQGGDR